MGTMVPQNNVGKRGVHGPLSGCRNCASEILVPEKKEWLYVNGLCSLVPRRKLYCG